MLFIIRIIFTCSNITHEQPNHVLLEGLKMICVDRFCLTDTQTFRLHAGESSCRISLYSQSDVV